MKHNIRVHNIYLLQSNTLSKNSLCSHVFPLNRREWPPRFQCNHHRVFSHAVVFAILLVFSFWIQESTHQFCVDHLIRYIRMCWKDSICGDSFLYKINWTKHCFNLTHETLHEIYTWTESPSLHYAHARANYFLMMWIKQLWSCVEFRSRGGIGCNHFTGCMCTGHTFLFICSWMDSDNTKNWMHV